MWKIRYNKSLDLFLFLSPFSPAVSLAPLCHSPASLTAPKMICLHSVQCFQNLPLCISCRKTVWSLYWHAEKPLFYTPQKEENWFRRLFIDNSDCFRSQHLGVKHETVLPFLLSSKKMHCKNMHSKLWIVRMEVAHTFLILYLCTYALWKEIHPGLFPWTLPIHVVRLDDQDGPFESWSLWSSDLKWHDHTPLSPQQCRLQCIR